MGKANMPPQRFIRLLEQSRKEDLTWIVVCTIETRRPFSWSKKAMTTQVQIVGTPLPLRRT